MVKYYFGLKRAQIPMNPSISLEFPNCRKIQKSSLFAVLKSTKLSFIDNKKQMLYRIYTHMKIYIYIFSVYIYTYITYI